MNVLMKETRRGWKDGFTCRQYVEGETYDIADDLARTFIRAGFAIETDQEKLEKECFGTFEKAQEDLCTKKPR